MANTFNLLRANDLIWSFVINNYLLGRDPFPFDLLHWNCDSTRMPAKMHSFYLRNMYMKNLLRKPGGLTLDGVKIDLSKVTVPTYFVSAIEDHIAPWKTTYAGPQILGGKSRFVLSGSGHIAGMINPPIAAKSTVTGPTTELPDDPAAWFAERHAARRVVVARLAALGGSCTSAANCPHAFLASGKLKVVEAAPGSYARDSRGHRLNPTPAAQIHIRSSLPDRRLTS